MKERVTGRESQYDLLRIVCAVGVIFLHVSSLYKNSFVAGDIYCVPSTAQLWVVLMYNMLPRVAVPCFFMLSGAFLLADERNGVYGYFYKKSFRKVGIPVLFFSLLYVLYSEAGLLVRMCGGEQISYEAFARPFAAWIHGVPYYHMWYVYTLAGVYLFVPVVVNLKKSIGEKTFARVSWCFFLYACISGWTGSYEFHWSLAKAACHLGYLMAGYQIRRNAAAGEKRRFAVIYIAAGILAAAVLACLQYGQTVGGIAEREGAYDLIGAFHPLTVAASILVFTGFSRLRISHRRTVVRLAQLTFPIYLVHALVLSCMDVLIRRFGSEWIGEQDCRIVIPLLVLIVFLISALLSAVYERAGQKLRSHFWAESV